MNNKRNKNKKGNKPHTETLPTDENKNEIKNEGSDAKEIDIESELQSPSAQEIVSDNLQKEEQIENEVAPKKPKRNKGKKKKTDKDDCGGEKDTTTLETAKVVATETTRVDEVSTEPEEIIPVVRKKKNKKKNVESVPEQLPPQEEVEIAQLKIDKGFDENIDSVPITPNLEKNEEGKSAKKKNKKKNLEISAQQTPIEENKIESPLIGSIKLEEDIVVVKSDLSNNEKLEEGKTSKKKNKKKKNRHDSEKSDKSGEIVSCTSAFQNILDDDENYDTAEKNLDIPVIDKSVPQLAEVTDDKLDKEVTTMSVPSKPEEKIITQVLGPGIDKAVKPDNETIHLESKGKKKNKKDKKLLPQSIEIENQIDPSSETLGHSSSDITAKTEDVPIEVEDPAIQTISKEESPKPKAKIAKPVQKKRKDKHESHIENPVAKLDAEPPAVKEMEPGDDKITTFQELVKEGDSEGHDSTLKICSVGDDNSSINVAGNKKKKKSPKAPEPIETSDINIENIEKNPKDILLKLDEQEIIKDELIFETLVPEDLPKSSETKLDDIIASIEEQDTKNIQHTTEEKSVKSRKKHKKSPKIHIDQESIANKGKDGEKMDSKNTVTPPEDIEIRSMKASESEGSICDFTPDVLHPRSASEQLTDDNNNTFIQEMSDSLDTGSTLTVPLVQGSGETPATTPEIVPCGIKLVESEILPPKVDEKSDIKSKMMEVNKDMEDLKLSIEKSLAGFIAMEKTDETKTEIKTDAQGKIKTEAIDKIAKDSENIKDISQSELGTKDKTATNIQTSVEPSTNEPIQKLTEPITVETAPVCPARRENKRGKKRKGNQESSNQTSNPQTQTQNQASENSKKQEDSGKNSNTKEETQQSNSGKTDKSSKRPDIPESDTKDDYEPIEKFEDALTSSADDINKTFEMIVSEIAEKSQEDLASNKPEINIIAPTEDEKKEPVSPPKNLLGRPNIPARSSKTDYKKEKDKLPNTEQAKVKIKDIFEIENTPKLEKERKKQNNIESFCQITNNDDFVYKYSFRKVFLQSACHVCKKDLSPMRVACKFCNLVFYCSLKHKDEDWPQHQALCFAVSTIVHVKDQKFIYEDSKNITGHNYRLLRMQTILSCEKVLKRRLVPWEQEVLLYPRICADVSCREWKQSKLKDCEGCGQISYCSSNPEHLPKSHQRWCKSYLLYQKLVMYQQTKGRLDPKLPSKVMMDYKLPEKINEVLASMFEEKIDLNDIQYAALTQIATAPLTVAYTHQIYRTSYPDNLDKGRSFTIHVVGAEMQFEADVLNKWEIFFLHLRPDVKELRVVLINPDLNPGKLPLALLAKIRLCENCRQNKRRVVFDFQDKKNYQEYRRGDEFIYPDIVCAFNANIHRSSVFNGKDTWPSTINMATNLKCPFLVTSHTLPDLQADLARVRELADVQTLVDPRPNPFSSVRPDRNFITDDQTPLLYKNHCFMVLCGF